MTQLNQVLQKTKQVLAQAGEMFGLDLSHVGIRFDLKGRAAGQACRRGSQYYIRYNRDMLTRDAFDHIYNDTIPHEIAHIVCFMNPRLGRMHDTGWARVCRQLGGSGARYHEEEVVYGKGVTYEYVTDRGHTVRIGDRYHAMLQAGRTLTYKKGKGKITKESQYSIVGVAGRTIAPKAVNKPAVVPVAPAVQAVRAPVPTERVVNVAPVAAFAGASKASVSRSIMLSGHTGGKTYEEIIAAMMAACGYDRQLARATFKANAAKVGIPVQ